jgi:hypothetical protein
LIGIFGRKRNTLLIIVEDGVCRIIELHSGVCEVKYLLVPTVIFFASMIIPLSIVLLIRHQRRERRSPLTFQLLRSPGESLAKKIDKVLENLDIYLTYMSILPLLCFTMYLSVHYLGKSKVSWLVFFVLCIGFMTYYSFKLATLIKKSNSLRLGLDCERAVGQELNQLMLDGYRVFHDFPAEKFNIDHIVIGSNGVFAVETKGRAKPVKGEVKITYDGQGMQFPTHYEQEPCVQAKRQAEWLSKWLTSAVGAEIEVKPVLVYPGWYIERKKPGLLIYNGKNPRALYKNAGAAKLSSEMIQRISHQVEQRCRDVVAQAYKKLTLKELLEK